MRPEPSKAGDPQRSLPDHSLLREYGLSAKWGMKRCVIGPAEKKTASFGFRCRFFGEVFFLIQRRVSSSQSSTENFSTAEVIALFTSLHAFLRSTAGERIGRTMRSGLPEYNLVELGMYARSPMPS